MPNADMAIARLMTSPVVTVPEDAPLARAYGLLEARVISCVAVTGSSGAPMGVLSRTDLLRVGRVAARIAGVSGPAHARATTLLVLPDRPVREVMRAEVVSVPLEAPVAEAAQAMVARGIHRVFVRDGDALVGVLSTKDLLIAVHASHDGQPLRDHMRAPAYTIRMDESLALATDRLAHAHVSGLCVVDEHEHPVGTFTQTEALAARDRPSETRVEEVMSYAMLCLDVRTPLYRAAAHAHATRARRVLAVEGGHVRGVLTGLDFARALAR